MKKTSRPGGTKTGKQPASKKGRARTPARAKTARTATPARAKTARTATPARAKTAARTPQSSGAGRAAPWRATPTASVRATEVKNEFGRILDEVIRGNVFVITKHDVPTAVLLSVQEYDALTGNRRALLETLESEMDDVLMSMQTPQQRAGADAAFRATPEELGRAAVAGALREAAKRYGDTTGPERD